MRSALAAILVLALVAAVFWPGRDVSFVDLDDPRYVTENDRVLEGCTGESLAWAWSARRAGNWHPLTWWSHMLDVELFGLDAAAHRRVNALLHGLNAALLLTFLLRATGAPVTSVFVALFFALHPLRVESVAWVSERKDLLSATFFFLALHAWCGYARRGGAARYLTATGLVALGLMAKSMLVTMPFVLLLLDVWPLGRLAGGPGPERAESPGRTATMQALALEKIPLLVLSLASSVVTVLAQRSGDALASFERLPLAARLSNAVHSYWAYVAETVWPGDLAVFYPYPGGSEALVSMWSTFGSLALVLALTGFFFAHRRARPFLLAGWLLYLGMLVPVIGIVQVGGQAMADRYTYLPGIGLGIALGFGVRSSAGSSRVRRAAAGAGLLGLALLATFARAQVRVWHDTETLARHALSATEENWMAHLLLARVARRDGRVSEAVEHYRSALAITPGLAVAHFNLANALVASGDRSGAEEHYRRAIQARPDHGRAHYNLGDLLYESRRLDEALEHYREACRLLPDFAGARVNLGNALFLAGRPAEAIEQYDAALSIDPGHTGAGENRVLAERALRERSSEEPR